MPEQPTSTSDVETRFIARMRTERERRGWSQARLAEEANEVLLATGQQPIHPSAITKLEWALHRPDEARNLRLNEAIAIADAFELDLEDLIQPDNKLAELRTAVDEAETLVSLSQAHLDAARASRDSLREKLDDAMAEERRRRDLAFQRSVEDDEHRFPGVEPEDISKPTAIVKVRRKPKAED